MQQQRLTGSLGHEFSNLVQSLHDVLDGDPLVYLSNVGNGGDALIAEATFRLFRRAGIPFELGDHEGDYAGRVVALGGGGNLTGPNSHYARLMARHHDLVKRFVLLPHTVNMYGDLIGKLGSKALLFARERETLRFLEENVSAAEVAFCDDLALSLTKEDLADLTSPFALARRFFPERIRDYRVREVVKILAVALAGRGNLMALRVDVEKTDRVHPKVNIDVSKRLFPNGLSETESEFIARLFMIALRCVGSIESNRLHVGIAGALLGKPTAIYDNSYGKNANIFRASLQDVPKVKFMGV